MSNICFKNFVYNLAGNAQLEDYELNTILNKDESVIQVQRNLSFIVHTFLLNIVTFFILLRIFLVPVPNSIGGFFTNLSLMFFILVISSVLTCIYLGMKQSLCLVLTNKRLLLFDRDTGRYCEMYSDMREGDKIVMVSRIRFLDLYRFQVVSCKSNIWFASKMCDMDFMKRCVEEHENIVMSDEEENIGRLYNNKVFKELDLKWLCPKDYFIVYPICFIIAFAAMLFVFYVYSYLTILIITILLLFTIRKISSTEYSLFIGDEYLVVVVSSNYGYKKISSIPLDNINNIDRVSMLWGFLTFEKINYVDYDSDKTIRFFTTGIKEKLEGVKVATSI